VVRSLIAISTRRITISVWDVRRLRESPRVSAGEDVNEIKGEPLSRKHARREVAVLGRGGTSFAPVMHYLDTHRDYDGLIIFTDAYAPVPPRPRNCATRILWLFNNETTHRRMHQALYPLGQSVYLKADGRGDRAAA
jgi:hypothetical protein